MTKTKAPTSSNWGGRRKGSGRKPRVKGSAAEEPVMLKFTVHEALALERMRPEGTPLAAWLRDELLDKLMVRCNRCHQIAYTPKGRPLYGEHVCPGK